MRNLKKFLALVLAMMMVMGMMVTVNAAAEPISPSDNYADSEEITPAYKEAVDVLTGVSAISGYTDDTIRPDETFTRAALATMLYKVRNRIDGDKNPQVNFAKDLGYFTDVPSSHWAAGYINYAYEQNWVEGRGNGIYDPNTDVKVVEVLAAMLNILEVESVSNSGDWRLNAINTALAVGLIDEDFIDSVDVVTGNATREEAIYIIFNTMMQPTGDIIYTVSDGSDVAYVGTDREVAIAYITARPGYDLDMAQTNLLWDTYTTAPVRTTDPYSRPVTAYVQGTTQLVVVPDRARIDQDTVVSGLDLYTTLRSANKLEAKITSTVVWNAINGYTITDGVAGSYTGTPNNRETTVKVNDVDRVDTTPYGGNGVTVEIYSTSTAQNTYKAVVIAPVYAQIKDVRNYRETATHGAYTEYIIETPQNERSTEELRVYSTILTNTDRDLNNLISVNGASKGDWVIVDTIRMVERGKTLTRYEITPVETIQGTLSKYDANTGVYTIGGAAYPASGIIGNTNSLITVDNRSHIFALDADGNVVGILGDTASGNYIFSLDIAQVGQVTVGDIVEPRWRVTGINAKGELTSLLVESVDGGTPSASTSKILYAYTDTNNNGLYELNRRSQVAVEAVKNAMYPVTASLQFNSGAILGKPGTAYEGLLANEATKYYLVAGSAAAGFTVTPYTGFRAVGSISPTVAAALDLNGNGVADVVFAWGAAASPVPTYAYIISDYVYNGRTYTYTAIIDGEVVDDLVLTEPVVGNLPVLVEVQTTGNEVKGVPITSGGTLNGTSNYINTNNTDAFYFEDGTLMSAKTGKGITSIGANVPVYWYNEGTVEQITASELTSSYSGAWVIVLANTNGITAMYIVGDAEPFLAPGSEIAGEMEFEGDIEAGDEPITVSSGGELTVNGNVSGDIIVDGGELIVKEDVSGEITVKDGGELTVEGNVKQGAKITTDDLSKVTVGGECEEAIEYTGTAESADEWYEDVKDPIIIAVTTGEGEEPDSLEKTEGAQTIIIRFLPAGTGANRTFRVNILSGTTVKAHIDVTDGSTAVVFCPNMIDGGNEVGDDARDGYLRDGAHGAGEEGADNTFERDASLTPGYYTVEVYEITDGTVAEDATYSGGFNVVALPTE